MFACVLVEALCGVKSYKGDRGGLRGQNQGVYFIKERFLKPLWSSMYANEFSEKNDSFEIILN